MNRRRAVKNLIAFSGGTLTLTFLMQACNSSEKDGYPAMLASVVDTIIPAGGGRLGALALGVGQFMEKLINDCYEKPVQDNVRKQLSALGRAGFIGREQQQRQEMLLKLAGSTDKDEKDFFTLMKTETIRGFNTSEKVMVDYLHYKVAPGHYYGCAAVKA